MDRKGKELPLAAQPNNYIHPHISPDGTKLAFDIYSDIRKSDIWIWDFVRETMTRLTFNGASSYPLWTPDGKRIAFCTGCLNQPNSGVLWKAADGTGEDEKLDSVPDRLLAPWSWSNDGKILVVVELSGVTGYHIGSLSIEGDRKWKPLSQGKYTEVQPQISPDGRWMAYTSNESGRNEVYVCPFPEVNKGRWQVSTSGGGIPLWSPNGQELFYRNKDSVMVVAVETTQTFKCGKPGLLFQGTDTFFQDAHHWDISSDGKRFLMMKEVVSTAKPAAEAPRKINIVVNWLEELKQRVPVK